MSAFILSDTFKIVSMPRQISVRGRQVPPGILFSSSLAEPLVYWLAASMGERLFGGSGSWGSLRADPKHLMGMSWLPTPETSISQQITDHGIAQQFLILSEAVAQVVAPAIHNPKFDYAELLVTFRDAVDFHYAAGDIVSVNQLDLHKILYNQLHSKKLQNAQDLKPGPAISQQTKVTS